MNTPNKRKRRSDFSGAAARLILKAQRKLANDGQGVTLTHEGIARLIDIEWAKTTE